MNASVEIVNNNNAASVTISHEEVTFAVPTSATASVLIETGPQGPAGPNKIGDKEIQVADLQIGDLLRFSSENVWKNVNETQITDGGNF